MDLTPILEEIYLWSAASLAHILYYIDIIYRHMLPALFYYLNRRRTLPLHTTVLPNNGKLLCTRFAIISNLLHSSTASIPLGLDPVLAAKSTAVLQPSMNIQKNCIFFLCTFPSCVLSNIRMLSVITFSNSWHSLLFFFLHLYFLFYSLPALFRLAALCSNFTLIVLL